MQQADGREDWERSFVRPAKEAKAAFRDPQPGFSGDGQSCGVNGHSGLEGGAPKPRMDRPGALSGGRNLGQNDMTARGGSFP